MKLGLVSTDFYFMYAVSKTNQYTVIRRVNAANNPVWTASFQKEPSQKSLAVDPLEQNVYFTSLTSPIYVFRLQSTNGGFTSATLFSNINGNSQETSIHPLSDSTGYILFGQFSSQSRAYICKQIVSPSVTNANCQYVPSIYQFSYAHLKITDTQVFFGGIDQSSTSFHFIKMTLGNSVADWSNNLSCPTSSCNTFGSEALLSSDGTLIYSFVAYGNPRKMHFITFNAASGAVVGNRYKSSISMYSIFGSVLMGNYIITTPFEGTPNYFMLFNTVTQAFTIKKFSAFRFEPLVIEPSSGRLVATGQYGNYGYITKFRPESIDAHPDFVAGDFTMNTIASGTEIITSESSVPISTVISESFSTPSFTDQSLTYVLQGSNYQSPVYYPTLDQSITIAENSDQYLNLELPCNNSLASGTAISYQLASYNGVTLPSYLAIDQNNGSISISSNIVTADTDIAFYVNSAIPGIANPIQKVINLKILNCLAQNCQRCTNFDAQKCDLCDSGYSLSSYSCSLIVNTPPTSAPAPVPTTSINNSTNEKVKVSEFSDNAKTSTQITASITPLLIIISSLSFPSSLSSLWLSVHQIQIFFLLLITGAYIPKDVQNSITGLSFVLFPYGLIPFDKYKNVKIFIDNFRIDLSNSIYESLNLKSNSTVFNTYSLIILVFTVVFLHISALCLMKKVADCINYSGRCSCCVNIPKWIINKVYNLMTFDYYIRTFLSSNQFLLVCSIYEVNRYDTSSLYKMISFGYACFILFICLLVNLIIFWISLTTNFQSIQEDNKFRELFKGIKAQKKARFHVGVIMLRRTLFIAALVCLKFCSFGILIGSLCLIQITYLAWTVIVRPYSEIKSNIIEIINEIYFLICFGALLFVHTESSWTFSRTKIYTGIIASNSIIIFIIVFIDFIIKIITKCVKKCIVSSTDETNDISRIRPRSPRIIMVDLSQNTTALPKETYNKNEQETRDNRGDGIDEDISNIQILRRR